MKTRTAKALTLLVAIKLGALGGFCHSADILINAFEGSDYGAWTVIGAAFGNGPAHQGSA